jgi:AraC-like DNA-binding protein
MRGAALIRYAEACERAGLDAKALVRAVGVDRRIFTDPEYRLPADKVYELLERAVEASGVETFGLQMSQGRRLPDYGPISLLLMHERTPREVLLTFVRYQRMLNEALIIHLDDVDDATMALRIELLSDVGAPRRQAYELAIATYVEVFRGPNGPVIRPLAVHFTHGPPADLAVHRAMLGPAIHFHSTFNGLICSRAQLDAPNPFYEPGLLKHAEQFVRTLPFAQHDSLTTNVERAIQRALPDGNASIALVAARLGVTERTLQRQLSRDGVDFSRLLNDTRRDQAVRYVDNPTLPLGEVAGLLGYRQETSFARWFAAEFGVTPSAWRAGRRPQGLPSSPLA